MHARLDAMIVSTSSAGSFLQLATGLLDKRVISSRFAASRQSRSLVKRVKSDAGHAPQHGFPEVVSAYYLICRSPHDLTYRSAS